MSRASERQVLYALVSGGFVVVVAFLTAGAALAGVTPAVWTVVMASLVVAGGLWMAANWRRTARVLMVGIGLFVVWMVGTLMTAL